MSHKRVSRVQERMGTNVSVRAGGKRIGGTREVKIGALGSPDHNIMPLCKGSPSVELGIRSRDPQREPSSTDCPRVERDCRT